MAQGSRVLLRSLEAIKSLHESKVSTLVESYNVSMKEAIEEAGVIFDPNIVEWVELHVESSDLHDTWALALTLYFEGEPQVDISKSLGVAQPYISRRAKQFLKWIKDKYKDS